MNFSEVLNKAADLIEPEGAWTQKAWARTPEGDGVSPVDRRAYCWCMVGALRKVLGYDPLSARPPTRFFTDEPAYKRLVKRFGPALGLWNDAPERTQAEVVAALRKAAEAAS